MDGKKAFHLVSIDRDLLDVKPARKFLLTAQVRPRLINNYLKLSEGVQ